MISSAPNFTACRRALFGELGAGDAVGEAEVVLDPARGPGLPARGHAFDEHGPQALRASVHRCAEAAGAPAHDHEVAEVARRGRGQARPVGDLVVVGLHERLALGGDEHRQPVGPQTGGLEQPGALGVVGEVEPEGDLVAGQEVAELVRPRRPPVADDPDVGARAVGGLAPRGEELVDHWVELLLGRELQGLSR